MARLAQFKITHELLVDLLRLPPGTRIVYTSNIDRDLTVCVESVSLPDQRPGSDIPMVQPQYRQKTPAEYEAEFVGWNPPAKEK